MRTRRRRAFVSPSDGKKVGPGAWALGDRAQNTRRAVNLVLSTLLILALIVAAYFAGRTASTITPVKSTGAAHEAFYLDIGGSASTGTQPTGVATHNGHRTLVGYADDLVMIEKTRGVSLDLWHVGCPGETVQSMLDTVKGDRCYTPPTTQLSLSLRYLKRHHGLPGVVTIDLGLNNIRPCISHLTVGEACAARQSALVVQDLPIVLKDLAKAAGPRVRFIGLEYEDPFLSDYLDGTAGPELATQTLFAMDRFNAALHEVYAAANVPVANIPAAFKSDDSTRVTIDNVGVIPENVIEICQLTWMCQPPPYGPDAHPNNEGYMAIAEAVAANLPKSNW